MAFPDPEEELVALTDTLSLAFVPLLNRNADDERFALLSVSDRINAYTALGQIYYARYQLNDVADDFKRCVAMFKNANSLMRDGDERRSGLLLALSKAFLLRSECTASLAPLLSANDYATQAWNLTIDNPKAIAELLVYIGRRIFWQYYLLTREVSHLNAAISNIATALDLDEQLTYWDDYSTLLLQRFSKTHSVPDLENAIKLSERCVSSTEAEISKQASFRLHLGKGLMYRHELTGSIVDINRAIAVARKAVQSIQPFKRFDAIKSRGEQAYREFDRLAQYLLLLFLALSHRFRCTPSKQDALEAMQLGDAVLNAASNFPTTRVSIKSHFETLTQLLRMALGASSARPSLVHPVSGEQPVKIEDSTSENQTSSPVVRGEQLVMLANQSAVLWNESRDPTHLDEAILRHEQAFQLLPDYNSLDRYIILVRLFNIRFLNASSWKDHDQALKYAEKVFSMTSKTGPNYSASLVLLGTTLRLSAEFEQVARAIDLLEQALEIIPTESPERQGCVFNLSVALSVQFQSSGDQSYVDRQIDLERGAIPVLLEKKSPDAVRHLCALSFALTCRYKLDGNRKNIDEAIELINKAIELPVHHAVHQAALHDRLGWCYVSSYEVSGSVDDLRQAIHIFERTLSITPAISPSAHEARLCRQRHLIYTLRELFFHTGSSEDLEAALTLCKDWISKLPDSGTLQTHVSELAIRLLADRALFEGSGNDLDHLSKIRHQKSSLTSAGNHLQVFHTVFKGLDRVVSRIKEKLGPQHSYDLSLSVSFPNWNPRSESDQSDEDIIQVLERLEPRVRGLRKSLVRSLLACWKQLKETMGETESMVSGQIEVALPLPLRELLERAIKVCKEALNASAGGIFHRHYMGILFTMLIIRVNLTESLDDLDELIECEEKLLEITPLGHSQQGTLLRFLSQGLRVRFGLSQLSEDLDRSIQLKDEAASTVSLSPRQRFITAVTAAELCFKTEPPELKRAQKLIRVAVNIMPMVALRHMSRIDLQGNVSVFGSSISKVVSLALDCGEEPSHCLRILESGRGVMSGMHIDLRAGGSQLAELPDQIAREFAELQRNLNSPFLDCQSLDLLGSDLELLTSPTRFFAALEEPRKNAAAFSDRLKTIRSFRGFESFLTGLSESEMKSLAVQGPIVVFNMSEIRSDAFIVTPLKIWSVPLPQLTYPETLSQTEKLLKAVNNVYLRNIRAVHRTVREILEWLWDVAVGRVLDELGFTKTPQGEEVWPHVWWVCCGVLSFFPVHMAGYHQKGSDRSALDRVISSYASTLRSLSYARSSISRQPSDVTPRVLLVGMSDTPNRDKLDIVQEMEKLKEVLKPVESLLINPDKKSFFEHLKGTDVLYLTCHAICDADDPARSRFLLNDWETDPLTFSDFASQTNAKRPQFANLSTCHNAVSRKFSLLDESIHLSSAAQMAGFPSVVGTLWKVYDSVATDVSTELYRNMRDENGRLNTNKAAEALHWAVCISVHSADK